MPNRLIREGFLDSEAIHSLSEPAECLYHRLLLVVDDAGRLDARPGLLRARLYPLGTRRTDEEIHALLAECAARGLVICYTCEDKPYLQLARWQRPGNSVYSRCPWRDGSHRVSWVTRETRDGKKEFCTTSLVSAEEGCKRGAIQRGEISSDAEGSPAPFFAPKSDPIEGDFRHFSEDGDGNEDAVSLLPERSAGPVSSRQERGSAPLAIEREGVLQSRKGRYHTVVSLSPGPVEDEPSRDREGRDQATQSIEDKVARPWAVRREGGESGQVGEGACSSSASGGPLADRNPVKGSALEKMADSAFEEFWRVYPKKRARDAARRVWMARRPPLAQCLTALEKLRRTEEWRKDGGQFIPHPANWLAAGGWEDVPEVDLRRGSPSRSFAAGGSGAGSGSARLLPGESPPGPVRDPDSWPDYVAEHPGLQGKHLVDLNRDEREAFTDWAFERQRVAFLNAKSLLYE